jgi:rSAM/selenodomain-associated transferase 1
LIRHTFRTLSPLDETSDIQVNYTGQSVDRIRTLGQAAGRRFLFQQQTTGDLGARLAAAFDAAFNEGCARVLAIGVDCPQLSVPRIMDAFHALQQNDVVVGPAVDGGYYLIGLRRSVPELFVGIVWGTPSVFGSTIKKSTALGLRLALLPTLPDLDRPEDLEQLRAMEGFSSSYGSIPTRGA